MDFNVAQPIFSKKNTPKALWDNNIHTIQDGRVKLNKLFIFMEIELFSYYFVFFKAPNMCFEKWKLAYLDQY